MKDDFIDVEDVTGRASKVDKWKYNDILNELARQSLYTLGTPRFGHWVKRFIKALRVVNVKNLPLRDMIDQTESKLKEQLYYVKEDQLKKQYEIWGDFYKRDIYLDKWREEYYEAMFDYTLDLATRAGFTFHLESIDESVALRG